MEGSHLHDYRNLPGARRDCYRQTPQAPARLALHPGTHGLRKGDFDAAENLITACRKSGELPLDICAEDASRVTSHQSAGLFVAKACCQRAPSLLPGTVQRHWLEKSYAWTPRQLRSLIGLRLR